MKKPFKPVEDPYRKQKQRGCPLCNEIGIEFVDWAWAFDRLDIGQASLVYNRKALGRHFGHLEEWRERVQGGLGKIITEWDMLTAREMAERIYNIAVEHVDLVRKERMDLVDKLEHLQGPLGIAMDAARLTGEITGEVKPPALQGAAPGQIGPSPLVVVMPRTFGLAQQPQAIEAMAEVIDVGEERTENGNETNDSAGRQTAGVGEPEGRDSGAEWEPVQYPSPQGVGNEGVAGVSGQAGSGAGL